MPDQASQPVEPTSLPAPDVNPWGALGQNIRAVWADCRLRVQELWRRNGEGDLWRPQLWPRDLAPLFWPLISGVVVALVAIAVVLASTVSHKSFRAHLPGEALESAQPWVEDTTPHADSVAVAEPPSSLPQVSASEPSEPAVQENLLQEPELSLESPPDPLLMELWDQATAIRSVNPPQELLVKLEAQPPRNALILSLGAPWARETALIHQQLADLWWQTVEAQGYDELTLRSQTGVVLGRSARVGHGMVINQSIAGRNDFTGMPALP